MHHLCRVALKLDVQAGLHLRVVGRYRRGKHRAVAVEAGDSVPGHREVSCDGLHGSLGRFSRRPRNVLRRARLPHIGFLAGSLQQQTFPTASRSLLGCTAHAPWRRSSTGYRTWSCSAVWYYTLIIRTISPITFPAPRYLSMIMILLAIFSHLMTIIYYYNNFFLCWPHKVTLFCLSVSLRVDAGLKLVEQKKNKSRDGSIALCSMAHVRIHVRIHWDYLTSHFSSHVAVWEGEAERVLSWGT